MATEVTVALIVGVLGFMGTITTGVLSYFAQRNAKSANQQVQGVRATIGDPNGYKTLVAMNEGILRDIRTIRTHQEDADEESRRFRAATTEAIGGLNREIEDIKSTVNSPKRLREIK